MKKNILRVFSFFTEKRNTKVVVSFLLLLCILCMKTGYCLDFTVGEDTYTVSDLETFRDYAYFNVFKQYDYSFGCWTKSYEYWTCIYETEDTRYRYFSNNFVGIASYDSGGNFKNQYTVGLQSGFFYSPQFNGGIQTISYNDINNYYSMEDIKDYDSGDIVFTNNFTFNDIECKYNTSDCQNNSGGDIPDEPSEDEDSNFPITKNEYYALLVLVGILIFMLFFKWCFPMKGGKKL